LEGISTLIIHAVETKINSPERHLHTSGNITSWTLTQPSVSGKLLHIFAFAQGTVPVAIVGQIDSTHGNCETGSQPCGFVPVPFFMTTKIFLTVFIVIATMMVGIGIIAPLMPVYAEQLGANGLWLGIIFAAFATTRMVFTPLFGRVSDHAKRGRKWFLLGGLCAFTLLSLGYFLSSSVYELTFMRMLHGMSSALVVPIAFAYIGDITPQHEEGKYMSIINLSTFVGMGIGPYLGGKLADAYGIRSAFWAMFGLGVLSAALVLFLLPDMRRDKTIAALRPPPFREMLSNDLVKGLVAVRAGSAVRRVFAAFIGLSKTHMGTIISVFVVTAAIVQYPAGMLADRYNKYGIVFIGEIVAILSFAFFPIVRSFEQLMMVGVVAGLAGGMAMPSMLAINAEIGREYGMASMMGLVDAAMGFGMLFGSLTSGVVMDAAGVEAVFYYGICAGIAGLVAFTFFVRRQRRLQRVMLKAPEIL
jgi:DHA1 family multidrug resistance protein-like MFS transporter